jgi:hypothetical protein
MTIHYRDVRGRILRADDQQPVHGLLVRVTARFGTAWETDADCTVPLGCDLTDRDGRFWIAVDASRFTEHCMCKGHLQFHLTVLDRDGHEVHAESRHAAECPPDTAFTFDIAVAPGALQCHFSRPLSWERPTEPLLPAWVKDDVEEALELVTGHADRDHGTPPQSGLDHLLCAKPALTIFDDLVDDAWKTLQGDIEAAGRYRNVLAVVCAGHSSCCCKDDGAHARAIDEVLAEPCDVNPCQPVKVHPQKVCCDKPSCAGRPLLVSQDKIAILVMAALHVSCGHRETARAYLIALLDQICRFQFLSALHQAAIDTIYEKPDAKPHFRDLLEWLACRCGSHEPGASCDGPPCCEICVPSSLLECIRDAHRNWCAFGCYTISSIVPSRACPGDTVVICGCGFGDQPGRVRFTQHGTMQPGPIVDAASWSNSRITVVVPQGAGCGLSLVPPLDTINVCGRFLDVRETGTALREFEGTSAAVLKFIIKGHQSNDCVQPGEVLAIRWRTCAADHVVVRIVDTATGLPLATLDPAPARGRWDFEQTQFTKTMRLRIEIVASGQCQPATVTRQILITVQRPSHLTIDGVEVTQAIQHYRAAAHLTDAADRGADNSLQLVANKSAWIRTSLRSGQDPAFDMGQLPNVSGTLRVERRVAGVWSVVSNLAPVNGPVTAQDSFASYDAERRDIDATLNFVVPAGVMTGLLRFTISVTSPHDCHGRVATSVQQVDVDLNQELRIAALTVGYNGPPIGGGPNVAFAAPTANDVATEAGFALRVYPVRSVPNIRVIDTQTATQSLNDNTFPAGGCDPNWTPILNMVANARTNDGNQAGWFYYGFVTPNIPMNHGNVGCANGGNGAGLLGGGTTLAHEVGHQAGLNHAPCGAVGTVTAGFPLYEPYDTGVTTVNAGGNTVWQDASIGEYGLDINDGTIFNPNPARPNNGKDLMGYCGTSWVSIFTHNFMVNNASMNPVALATGLSGAGHAASRGSQLLRGDPVKPFITLLGSVSRKREVDVTSLVRVPTRELTMSGVKTPLVVQLMGEDGEVASSAPVFTMPAHEGTGCGCGGGGGKKKTAEPPYAFIAALPDVTEGSAIRICDGDTVVWERKRPRTSLTLGSVRASVRKDGLYVSWDFEKKSATTNYEVWLRWSEDGVVWHGLAVGLSGNAATVDPSVIPAARVKVQVVAHDGFRSVAAETEPIDLPERAPHLAIIHPADGQTLQSDRPLHLWGASSGVKVADEPVWYVDGDEVGKGFDAWTTMPAPGEHTAELRVPGGPSARVRIMVAK